MYLRVRNKFADKLEVQGKISIRESWNDPQTSHNPQVKSVFFKKGNKKFLTYKWANNSSKAMYLSILKSVKPPYKTVHYGFISSKNQGSCMAYLIVKRPELSVHWTAYS